MAGIIQNHGYLKGVVYKELAAGRKCELTGSIVTSIKDIEEYQRKKDRLVGKFGEVVHRKGDGTALIATRAMPEWAERKLDEVVWECEEMLRWEVPGEFR